MCTHYGGTDMKFSFGQKLTHSLKESVNFIQIHTRYLNYSQMFRAYKINRVAFKILIMLLIGGVLFIPAYYVMSFLFVFVTYDYVCYQKGRKLKATSKVSKKLLKRTGYSCDYWTPYDGSNNSVEIVFYPTGTIIEDFLRRMVKKRAISTTASDELDSLVTYMNRCVGMTFKFTCTLEEYNQLEKYGLSLSEAVNLSNVPDKITYKSFRPKNEPFTYPKFIRCTYQANVEQIKDGQEM